MRGVPGRCPSGWTKNIYPRFDFNGDGIVSREVKANFKGQPKTDLEALTDVWGSGPTPDTEGWKASELPQLLDSGDLRLDLAELISSQALDRVIVTVSETPIPRIAPATHPDLVITAPAFKPLEIQAQGVRAGVVIAKRCATVLELKPGQDLNVELLACD